MQNQPRVNYYILRMTRNKMGLLLKLSQHSRHTLFNTFTASHFLNNYSPGRYLLSMLNCTRWVSSDLWFHVTTIVTTRRHHEAVTFLQHESLSGPNRRLCEEERVKSARTGSSVNGGSSTCPALVSPNWLNTAADAKPPNNCGVTQTRVLLWCLKRPIDTGGAWRRGFWDFDTQNWSPKATQGPFMSRDCVLWSVSKLGLVGR